MFYYEVATAGNTRGSTSIFTYESALALEIGTIVRVSIRSKLCLGFIVKNSSKPAFKTNALDTYEPTIILPKEILSTFKDLSNLYPLSESQLAGLLTPPSAPNTAPPWPASSCKSPTTTSPFSNAKVVVDLAVNVRINVHNTLVVS